MGIVNSTPDSFSDGGEFLNPQKALQHALHLVQKGAHILDVGGVSTRPDAAPVDAQEEWNRVAPLLRLLQQELPPEVLVSLDTSSPTVAYRAAQEGWLHIVNDVWAGRVVEDVACSPAQVQPYSTIDVAAQFDLGMVLMHMQGSPQNMQEKPQYKNCVMEVAAFLVERASEAQKKGVKFIAVDPGIGFGKTFEHNLELLSERGLGTLCALPFPLLIGLSRKRFLNSFLLTKGAGVVPSKNQPQSLPPSAEPLVHPLDVLSKEWESNCILRGARLVRSHRMPSEFK